VSWNFNKFLIDENGNWVAHYESRMDPMSAEITNFAAGKVTAMKLNVLLLEHILTMLSWVQEVF